MTESSNVTHVDFSFLKSRGIHCLALWKASLWNWLLHNRANMPIVTRKTRAWPEWRRWLRILKARHGRPLASERVRSLLDVEVAAKARATGGGCLDSRPDSTDGSSQQAVGSTENPWRAPQVGNRSGAIDCRKYLRRTRKPPSQTWGTFLTNHMAQMASMDFFTVPTATFRVLFVFLVLSHDRRRILHWNITEHPTEEWTVQQLREAFPWDEAPRYLIRDRDAIFGREIGATIKGMGTEAVVTAARSPWQNPFVERLIGSIRRECLDHVIVWNESSLQRVLQNYFEYYERSRTHLALNKDAPVSRPVEEPANGRVVEVAQVGGLHHRYQRCAA